MGGRFPTTEWSRVFTAREGSDSGARAALENLCQTYWPPLYDYVRRQGYDREAASDLTQAFFTELLEKHVLQEVTPSAGRFRSFLLASLRHFLSHERDRERALKRGGGAATVSLDVDAAEARLGAELADRLTPEQIFERRWALTVLDRALDRLRRASQQSGHDERFAALKRYLVGDAQGASYRDAAERLGMTEGAVKVAVLRMRRQFGEALRAEIADTVADPTDVDDEIRHLLAVIRPWKSPSP